MVFNHLDLVAQIVIREFIRAFIAAFGELLGSWILVAFPRLQLVLLGQECLVMEVTLKYFSFALIPLFLIEVKLLPQPLSEVMMILFFGLNFFVLLLL